MSRVTSNNPWADTFTIFTKSEISPPFIGEQLQIGIASKTDVKCGNYALYNTEQLTRECELVKLIKFIRDTNPIDILDFSEANVKILDEYGIRARHVPLRIPDSHREKIKTFRREAAIAYDFGFCGSMSKRRNDVIAEIVKLGKTVNVVSTFDYDLRDRELAKCRAILNIHYAEDYRVFESCRCDPWLEAGVPVVTENSLDDDPRAAVVAKYSDLAQTAVDFVSCPKESIMKLFLKYAAVSRAEDAAVFYRLCASDASLPKNDRYEALLKLVSSKISDAEKVAHAWAACELQTGRLEVAREILGLRTFTTQVRAIAKLASIKERHGP